MQRQAFAMKMYICQMLLSFTTVEQLHDLLPAEVAEKCIPNHNAFPVHAAGHASPFHQAQGA